MIGAGLTIPHGLVVILIAIEAEIGIHNVKKLKKEMITLVNIVVTKTMICQFIINDRLVSLIITKKPIT